ncbi:MAG: hypothetical protein IPM79_32600 [Polyangiaceae bacterium]|nr:hypothetical protein [Polyangiaceae bacterium]
MQRIGTTLDAEDAKLLPSKEHLVVQPFQDQKSRRTGYGDVVFLPEGGLTGDRAKAVEPFVRSTLLPSGAQ